MIGLVVGIVIGLGVRIGASDSQTLHIPRDEYLRRGSWNVDTMWSFKLMLIFKTCKLRFSRF